MLPADRSAGGHDDGGTAAVEPARAPLARGRFHLLVPAVLAVLTAITAFVILVPGFQFVTIAPVADHVANAAATLAAGGVAVLAWIRYSQTGEPDSLLQAAAFLTLFCGGALSLVLLLSGQDIATGFGRNDPGQGPLYLWTIQRSVAAALLLVGALAALRRLSVRSPATARAIALGPAAVVVLVSLLVLAAGDLLPTIVPTERLRLMTMPTDTIQTGALSATLMVSQLTVAAIYLAAALAYARLYDRRGRRAYIGFLTAGLAVAAFSQLHFAVVPGAYSDLLTSGDVLRLAFYAIVLAGVAAAVREDLVQLHRANVELVELREADARRVTLEERARLAREVHDGLVQELWLARLTHGQMAQLPSLPADAREIAGRVDGILEDALAEARQAIVAMQPQADASFGSLLERFVEDYGDRFGLEVECTVTGEPRALGGHEQAEVLRICREALNNARKHADASVVRVRLHSDADQLRLSVSDNGRGFDAAATTGSGFGMQSMRDRAAGLGATLRVMSAPMDGTEITLELPLGADAQPSRG